MESYVTSFVVLFTTVEIATGLFDFATSSQSMYPVQIPHEIPWYFIVENWLTPGGVYNKLGTWCWLVNTIYPICVCLEISYWVCSLLLPFAILYAWHEVSQAVFIIENWKETTASLVVGINFMRSCVEIEKKLIQEVYDLSSKFLSLKPTNEKERLIMWGNLFVDGQFHTEFEHHHSCQAFHSFVEGLVKEMYSDQRDILSYGFISSPSHGTETQNWHHDYSQTVSNLFIPLVQTTNNNATEFIRHPNGEMNLFKHPKNNANQIDGGCHKIDHCGGGAKNEVNGQDANQYHPEPHLMFETEKTEYLEISKVIARPFSILKLTPGCVHRGVANKENVDRVLFFISTNVKGCNLVVNETFDRNVELDAPTEKN